MLGIFMTHFLACAIQLDCFVAALLAMTSKDVVIILKKRQLNHGWTRVDRMDRMDPDSKQLGETNDSL
jgi:hypothetical protein